MSTEIMKLKSWPAFFKAIKDGEKTHDLRNARDRDFYVGQRILMQEYCPFTGRFSGREIMVVVTYITSHHTPCAVSSAVLDRDFVVLSIKIAPPPVVHNSETVVDRRRIIGDSMLAGEQVLNAMMRATEKEIH